MNPTAWREGYNARKVNRPRNENPYVDLKPRSPRAGQWDDGWRFADTWRARTPSRTGDSEKSSPAVIDAKSKSRRKNRRQVEGARAARDA
jgi:ribosome modulation factor